MSAGESTSLLEKILDICQSPPPGVEPWKKDELLQVVDRAQRHGGDQAASYLEFIQAAQDLIPGEETEILKRFGIQSLQAEASILAQTPWVRDHLSHVTQVYLIGWAILNGCRLFRCTEKDWQPYGWRLTPQERFERLNRAWLYAALLHDAGYPIEYAGQAADLEIRTRELFGNLFIQSSPGRVADKELFKAVEPLWRLRNKWKGLLGRPPEPIEKKIIERCAKADHGVLSAAALWREAQQRKGEDLQEALKAAALAAWCHNWFSHAIDTNKDEKAQPNAWLQMSMANEPLSVLLLLCDELQEWGRERKDVGLANLWGVSPKPFEGTDLMKLDIDDACGLTIKVELRRRLRPEEHRRRERHRRDAERKIAEKRRWLRQLFPKGSSPREMDLHLRVDEWVDHERCRNAWEAGWDGLQRGIEDIATSIDQSNAGLPPVPTPMSVDLARHDSKDLDKERVPTGVSIRFDDNRASVRLDQPHGEVGLRLVVIGPGARGKSTLLRSLSLSLNAERRRCLPIYIEQLDDELIDLEQAIELKREEAEGIEEVFLLVDHLDRLVEEPSGEYWLDQLAQLPQWPWLHVIMACRPEEYGSYIQGSLSGAYADARLEPKSLGFGGDVDDEGRVLTRSVLKEIRATAKQFDLASRLALSFEQRRSQTLSSSEQKALEGATYRNSPILTGPRHKRTRFVHDTVQDALAAAGLARELALAIKHSKPDQASRLVAKLQRLPRDSLRMLLDLLSEDRLEHDRLTRDELQQAAEGLAMGMIVEPSTHQWLSDTTRMDQAMQALQRFDRCRPHDMQAKLLANWLLGHVEFLRCKVQVFMDTSKVREEVEKHAKPGIERLAEAARILEDLIAEEDASNDDRPFTRFFKSCLAFQVDQLLMLLARMFYTPHIRDETLNHIRILSTRLKQAKDPKPLEPGWARLLLDRFSRARSEDDADQVQIQAFAGINESSKQTEMKDLLDVRLSYMAGHLSTRLIEHVFARRGVNIDRNKLADALFWRYRALALWEKEHRRYLDALRAGETKKVGSEAQLLANIAVQWRGVYEATLYQVLCGKVDDDLRNRILVAHQNHEDAWTRVENKLDTAEKIPVQYDTALPHLLTGRFATKILTKNIDPAHADKVVGEITKKILDHSHTNAERHPRHHGREQEWKDLWQAPSRVLGTPRDFMSAMTKT